MTVVSEIKNLSIAGHPGLEQTYSSTVRAYYSDMHEDIRKHGRERSMSKVRAIRALVLQQASNSSMFLNVFVHSWPVICSCNLTVGSQPLKLPSTMTTDPIIASIS